MAEKWLFEVLTNSTQLWGPFGGVPGLGWGSMIHRWNGILGGYKNM